MKNSILCLLVLLGLCQPCAWGQGSNPPGDGDGNLAKELRAALAGLNASRIPSGVLLNRVLAVTKPHRYAGQGDTVVSYRDFEQQYWEFYYATLDSTRLPTVGALQASISQRVQQGAVPLLMLSYSYNEFAATAAQDHLITIDSVNERVTDGPDLSRSPYTTGQLFSVSLPVKVAGTILNLYVGPEYWLGNTAAPSTVAIDFGDGWGFRTVAMGSTIQVQVTPAASPSVTRLVPALATGPIKTGPFNLPSPSMASGSSLRVKAGPAGLFATASLLALTTASLPPDKALGLVASRNWAGFVPVRGVYGPNGRATAIAWIKYAASNTTGKLRRPLVFVEGIDFDEYRSGIGPAGKNHAIAQTGLLPLSDFETYPASLGGYRNGNAGWNEVVDYDDDYKSLEKFPLLREQLQASASQVFQPSTPAYPNGTPGGDYDLVFLDFSDGATLI